jgi:hypothetical protein
MTLCRPGASYSGKRSRGGLVSKKNEDAYSGGTVGRLLCWVRTTRCCHGAGVRKKSVTLARWRGCVDHTSLGGMVGTME